MRRYANARGFTLIELLIVVSIIGVVAATAVPALMRARMSANEAAALGSMRAINSAQSSYASATGGGGFAFLLATLAIPCPSSTASFISPDLSTDPSVKSGYTIALAAGGGSTPGRPDCNGTATRSAYYAIGTPLTNGFTAQRAFATNGSGTVFFSPDGVPPTEAQMAPGGGGTPIQ